MKGLSKYYLFIVILICLTCKNVDSVEKFTFSIEGKKFSMYMKNIMNLQFYSASTLGNQFPYLEILTDSLNKVQIKASYNYPENGEFSFWNNNSNDKFLYDHQVPVDCGVLISKEKIIGKRGFIFNSVVVQNNNYYFKKVSSFYTDNNGVFTFILESTHNKKEITLDEILKRYHFFNEIQIDYDELYF